MQAGVISMLVADWGWLTVGHCDGLDDTLLSLLPEVTGQGLCANHIQQRRQRAALLHSRALWKAG